MNELIKFLGKWMDLEGIILSEVTQSQKNSRDMYLLISGYYGKSFPNPAIFLKNLLYICSPFFVGQLKIMRAC